MFFYIRNLFKANFCSAISRNYRSTYAKATQLETARMSSLRETHLKSTNPSAFDLFSKFVIQIDEIQFLNKLFCEAGYEIRLAGGGVRDILCEIDPHDIDFATNARPDEMLNLLSHKPGVRLITTEAGKKHGTITARINDKEQFEITTLRIDVTTDGRHAQVEFVSDWKIDSSRRDLTINSMFIDLNGVLYDFFNGEDDLKNRRIRFVGDVSKRLQEDYLRIFRYFRFHSRFGQTGEHDQKTLDIMKDNLAGLNIISGERIWSEMKRILNYIPCDHSIDVMFNKLDIGKYLGFGDRQVNLDEFNEVHSRFEKYSLTKRSQLKPQTLFASLVKNTEELICLINRLKLSNIERFTIQYIMNNRTNGVPSLNRLKRQLALEPNETQKNLKEFIRQYLLYIGAEDQLIEEVADWPVPKFPSCAHLVTKRVHKKSEISTLVKQLKNTWAERDYNMSEKDFKQEVDVILERLHSAKANKN